MKVITKKEIFKITIFILSLILMIYFSKINFLSTKNTIETFLKITLPSLFSFILFSQIIIKTDLIEIIGNKLNILSKIFKVSKNSSLIILLSYISGFPSSANMINTLYKENKISYKDAKILSSFTNNASPIFLISTIGLAMFNNFKIGIILLISHVLSSVIIGIIYSRIYTYIIHDKSINLNSFNKKSIKRENISYSIFELLEKSINNTFKICLNMLGLMIIFNIISEIILNTINVNNNIIKSVILGIFEIVNGCKNISLSTNNSIISILILTSFISGFSGLCIIFQIKNQFKDINIKMKELLIFKLLHGIISGILTYILLKFTNILDIESINVYSNIETLFNNNYSLNTLYNYYLNIIAITIIVISTIFVIKYYKKSYKKINNLY